MTEPGGEGPVGLNPRHVLETLRLGPDRVHIEPVSEEQTWLASYVCTFEGKTNKGLTDCCLVEDPCSYHRAIYEGESPVPWVPHLALVQHWTGVRARFDDPQGISP